VDGLHRIDSLAPIPGWLAAAAANAAQIMVTVVALQRKVLAGTPARSAMR
jgi:hypothetical protein